MLTYYLFVAFLFATQLGERVTTIPTIGFNVETVQYRNLSFTIWDVGGQDKIRSLWRYYYNNTDALIFVVDATDRNRFAQAAEELHSVLACEEMQHAKVLVFANKQDLPDAVSPSELVDQLNLRSLRHEWYMQACSATIGTGIYEGLDWITATITNK